MIIRIDEVGGYLDSWDLDLWNLDFEYPKVLSCIFKVGSVSAGCSRPCPVGF